jgi:DNA-binding SARP family transcriptional activator
VSNGPVTDPVIELRLIGRFVVIRDGAEVPAADFGGRKVRTLLRVLATRRGRFVPNDELTEHLWPDRAPVDPAANLQVLVTRARRAVGRSDLIVTGPGGYALASQSWCGVDTDRLLAALRDAEARTGRAALEVYRGALSDTDVEVLAEDRYADWAQPYRTQLARALQDARERAAAIALDCGEATLAVRYASVAATNEPLRETAALALIRALSAAGDQAAALAHYDTFRTALADELGVDPSPAATALQAQLLALDPGPGRQEQTRPAPSAFDPLSFVGRAEELAAIDRALAAGGDLGTARVVRIAGRSGTGKSRLLAEASVGRHVVSARAFWADRDEPWTLARAVLRDLVDSDVAVLDTLPGQLRTALSHLLPDADATPAAFDPASRRALIIEAMTRLVARRV